MANEQFKKYRPKTNPYLPTYRYSSSHLNFTLVGYFGAVVVAISTKSSVQAISFQKSLSKFPSIVTAGDDKDGDERSWMVFPSLDGGGGTR